MEEEYELIPVSPIRRLEKRMERIERTGSSTDTIRELVELIRANQHVIDDVVKINSEMMAKVSEIVASVNGLAGKVNDFMERIEVASEEKEAAPQEPNKMDERLAKLEKRLNALLLSSMARKQKQ